MARTVSFTDDMDGTPNAKERRFTIGDAHYVIDLNDENWAAMLAAIEPWRSLARVERKNGAFQLSDEDRKNIRIWAALNGTPLKDRGRFPHSVVQAYFDSLEEDDLPSD